jgi:putative endonuclease
MFYCYVLRSEKTGRRYVGSCENLADHIRRHNAGESKATKHGVPWILIHTESFRTRSEAAKRERYYKSGRGREELDNLRESGRRGDRPGVQIPPARFSRRGKLFRCLYQAPKPPKNGIWHKRLYTVIVEIPLFPCIPLSRS